MSAPKVVGLDLSLSRTGYADGDGITGVIKPRPAKLRGGGRLHAVMVELRRLLASSPVLVVVEDYSPGSVGIAGKLGNAELHGCVLEHCAAEGIPVVKLRPATLKRWATGNGSADKEAMMSTARAEGWVGTYDDEADAWHLRTAGIAQLSGGVPAWRLELLDAVQWPDVVLGQEVGR